MDFYSLIKRFPKDLIDKLAYCPQAPKYHNENQVLNHMYLVFKELKAKKVDSLDLYMACLFHDMGKLDTTHAYYKKGTIKIQALNHENYAEAYIEEYKYLFDDLTVNWNNVKLICREHMKIKNYLDKL